MSNDFNLTPLRVHGVGDCSSGESPPVSLDGFPGLCWMKNHPKFGSRVFLADQTATVEDVVKDIVMINDYMAVADKWKTQPEYIAQAVDYAIRVTYEGE